jgi:hypothetical protein
MQIFKQRVSKTQRKQKIKESKVELHEIFQILSKDQNDKRVGASELSALLQEHLNRKEDPVGLHRSLNILISDTSPQDLRMDFKQFYMNFTC